METQFSQLDSRRQRRIHINIFYKYFVCRSVGQATKGKNVKTCYFLFSYIFLIISSSFATYGCCHPFVYQYYICTCIFVFWCSCLMPCWSLKCTNKMNCTADNQISLLLPQIDFFYLMQWNLLKCDLLLCFFPQKFCFIEFFYLIQMFLIFFYRI